MKPEYLDLDAIALSLCLTCPHGVIMCKRGSAMPIDAWQSCLTAFDIPADGFQAARTVSKGPAAIGLEIDHIIRATRDLIGRVPTAREMWLIESTIRRTIT